MDKHEHTPMAEEAGNALRERCRREMHKRRLLDDVLSEGYAPSQDVVLKERCRGEMHRAHRLRRGLRLAPALAAGLLAGLGLLWLMLPVERPIVSPDARREHVPGGGYETVHTCGKVATVRTAGLKVARASGGAPALLTRVRTSEVGRIVHSLAQGTAYPRVPGHTVIIFGYYDSPKRVLILAHKPSRGTKRPFPRPARESHPGRAG